MTEVHLNICNFEEEVCDIVCESELPRCWDHYIFSHAKASLSNKISNLSQVETESIATVQHFVDGFDQIYFYDYKYESYEMNY